MRANIINIFISCIKFDDSLHEIDTFFMSHKLYLIFLIKQYLCFTMQESHVQLTDTGPCGLFGVDVQKHVALVLESENDFVMTHQRSLVEHLAWDLLNKLKNVIQECLVLFMVHGRFGRHGQFVWRIVQ
jgi:hypothetical protein